MIIIFQIHFQAYNGASLSVSTTVSTFVVDVSGPLPGYVHEVASGSSQDIDYQVLDPKLLVGHYFLSCGI